MNAIKQLTGIVCLLWLCASCASNKNATAFGETGASGPSSRNAGSAYTPGTSEGGSFSPNKRNRIGSKNSAFSTAEQAREAYEERMKENAKRYKKEAKLAEKPQYSDPSYFGHKRKPKKRKLSKRKLCKECGIVH